MSDINVNNVVYWLDDTSAILPECTMNILKRIYYDDHYEIINNQDNSDEVILYADTCLDYVDFLFTAAKLKINNTFLRGAITYNILSINNRWIDIITSIQRDTYYSIDAIISYHTALKAELPDYITELLRLHQCYEWPHGRKENIIHALSYIIETGDLSMLSELNHGFFAVKYERLNWLCREYELDHNDDLFIIIKYELSII